MKDAMDKKLLLIYPNTTNFGVMPLAISILSTIAKKQGYQVRYFETTFYKKDNSAIEDRNLSGETKGVAEDTRYAEYSSYEQMRKDFCDLLTRYQPEIIGVHCNSPEYELFCEDLLGAIPESVSKPFIIVGGCHATVAPKETIANSLIDAICIGEGEAAWNELLSRFTAGQDITTIKNLWVRKNSQIHKNPVARLLPEELLWDTELDISFFDDRHILSAFDGKLYRRGQIELSRGCPYNCTYCVNSGFKKVYHGLGKFVRTRPFENMKKSMAKLIKLGSQMIQFQDECFLAVSTAKLQKFLGWYAKEVKLPMMVQTRPETVTEEKIRLLAEMKIPVQLSLGIESGSPRILKDICHRNMEPELVIDAFSLIKKYNIRTSGFTMVGFPTETREEVFDTINLVRKCQIDVSIMSTFFPFPGIPLRKYCMEKGFITGQEKTRKFTGKSILKNQPMTPDEIENLRRCFALYTKLSEKYYPQIEACEHNYRLNTKQYNDLINLLYRDYYVPWQELQNFVA